MKNPAMIIMTLFAAVLSINAAAEGPETGGIPVRALAPIPQRLPGVAAAVLVPIKTVKDGFAVAGRTVPAGSALVGGAKVLNGMAKCLSHAALPVGATVVAAVTGYEIYQTCELYDSGEIDEFERNRRLGESIGKATGGLVALGAAAVIGTVLLPTGIPAVIVFAVCATAGYYALEYVGGKIGIYIAEKYNEHRRREIAIMTGLHHGSCLAAGVFDLPPELLDQAGVRGPALAGYARAYRDAMTADGTPAGELTVETRPTWSSERFAAVRRADFLAGF